ncbi:ABC transporter, putative [Bodo saltans]|uniref:ABC transporter, putative n=1 Tax=Bodo saltans TaxID=75058 RepID=A0A0S4KHN9_BODSA|nr:ABC transporter, putative [Bodo saltans]|eukprot:CUI15198.1 ABC transporter, putative [Bodo saltans]
MYDKDLLLPPTDEDSVATYEIFKVFWAEELESVEVRKAAAPDEVARLLIKPRLFLTLLKAFKKDILISAIGRIISDGLGVAAPFFLRELVKWLGYQVYAPQETKEYIGFIWAITLAVNQMLISISNNASLFHVQKAFCKMRTVCALAVYDKSLNLDASHGITGLIQQMHSTDAYKFIDMSLYFHQLWAAPCIIVAALISLYYFIGWAGVLALGVILVITPIQGIVAGKMMMARAACIGRADVRINAINEIMQGIRIIKFMGWEDRFYDRIEKIRAQEVFHFTALLQ